MMAQAALSPTILLVDDEPRILASLRRVLRKEGYVLLAAPDAQAALIEVEAHPEISVIISDQRMPGRSGVSLLKEVAERWPQVQRILLTGWSGEIPESEVEAAALFALLVKPWDDDELKRQLKLASSRPAR